MSVHQSTSLMLCKSFHYLKRLVQLENGLKQEIKPNGRHMLMLPTYVTQLPDGWVDSCSMQDTGSSVGYMGYRMGCLYGWSGTMGTSLLQII